jgi:NTP pyrophosphatase (non-canonical NTP hydrolase)
MMVSGMKVEFTESEITVMRTALDKWGLDAQCDQTVEECAELIVALHKQVKRTPKPDSLDDVIDEIADVEMMLGQMRVAFDIDDETLRERIERKFAKLAQYLETGE